MRALVKHMEESREIPTATSFRTLRVDVLDQRRRQLNQGIQSAGRPEKMSYTHIVAFAVVRALRDVPSMAVSFDRVDGASWVITHDYQAEQPDQQAAQCRHRDGADRI